MYSRALDDSDPAILGLQDGHTPWQRCLDFRPEVSALAEAAHEYHRSDVVADHGKLFLHEANYVFCDGAEDARHHFTARDGEAVAIEAQAFVDSDGEGVTFGSKVFFVLVSRLLAYASCCHLLPSSGLSLRTQGKKGAQQKTKEQG